MDIQNTTFCRRGPPDQDRYREREYPDKRDRFREEGYPSDRYVPTLLTLIPQRLLIFKENIVFNINKDTSNTNS